MILYKLFSDFMYTDDVDRIIEVTMSIKGKKIVFTGKMSQTRDEMTEEAEKAGADVVSAISGEVDYLVCGDQIAHNATNAKYKQAIKLGVKTLEEDEYRSF